LDQDIDHILAGGGQTGELLRQIDWSASPVGVPSTWPQALRTILSIVMGSNQPMFLSWGDAGTLLYNDAYAEILAEKHPAAVGKPFLKVWAEIEGDLIPIVAQAYRGEPVHMSDIELTYGAQGLSRGDALCVLLHPVRDEAAPSLASSAPARKPRRRFWLIVALWSSTNAIGACSSGRQVSSPS
jgi:hypothetical protein